jgi:ras-related protein rabX
MTKKRILLMIIIFLILFNIKSWGYWSDELKIKFDAPIIYKVELDIVENKNETTQVNIEKNNNIIIEQNSNIEQNNNLEQDNNNNTENNDINTQDNNTEMEENNVEIEQQNEIKSEQEDIQK